MSSVATFSEGTAKIHKSNNQYRIKICKKNYQIANPVYSELRYISPVKLALTMFGLLGGLRLGTPEFLGTDAWFFGHLVFH